jgi:hypothetical protein
MALTEIARLLPWLALHRLTRYPLSLISTLQKGHLYFAKQGTFLFCIDITKMFEKFRTEKSFTVSRS